MLLRDNLLGILTYLCQQPTYAFTAAAGSLASTTRFALVLRPSGALATHAGLQASQVSLYPNPAHQSATLLLPRPSTAALRCCWPAALPSASESWAESPANAYSNHEEAPTVRAAGASRFQT